MRNRIFESIAETMCGSCSTLEARDLAWAISDECGMRYDDGENEKKIDDMFDRWEFRIEEGIRENQVFLCQGCYWWCSDTDMSDNPEELTCTDCEE